MKSLKRLLLVIFIVYLLHAFRPALFGPEPAIWGHTLLQLAGILLVWIAIRLRPVLAASLEHPESAWATAPTATGLEAALLVEQQAASLDVRVAQAEARRGMELLR